MKILDGGFPMPSGVPNLDVVLFREKVREAAEAAIKDIPPYPRAAQEFGVSLRAKDDPKAVNFTRAMVYDAYWRLVAQLRSVGLDPAQGEFKVEQKGIFNQEVMIEVSWNVRGTEGSPGPS